MSEKINVNPLKGMMDLHPLEMQKHDFVRKGIEQVANQFCYEAYKLPILEARETFVHQATTELIQEQSYAFTDRAGREVLLRPEITPVLARMVAKESGRYTLPLRWYTIGNCYRYERPQKGRLREFAQLNFDIMGKQHILYDIEMFKLIDALMEVFNVPPEAYEIRFNHRGFVNTLLVSQRMEATEQQAFYGLIDKYHKMSSDEFRDAVTQTFTSASHREFVTGYVRAENMEELMNYLSEDVLTNEDNPKEDNPNAKLMAVQKEGIDNFRTLTEGLKNVPFKRPPIFDPTIVRGIDYYTGVVFEVFATGKGINRSLFGGGRYDSLVGNYNAKPMSAVGFGMGIHIFVLFLEQLGLLPETSRASKAVYLAPLSEELVGHAFSIAEYLRTQGEAVHLGEPRAFQAHFSRAKQKKYGYLAVLGENEIQAEQLDFKLVSNTEEKPPLNLAPILQISS